VPNKVFWQLVWGNTNAIKEHLFVLFTVKYGSGDEDFGFRYCL